MSTAPVTLQISLAPSDYAHAQHLLPHQVRAWRGQYDELLITVDLHRSAGRFSARWEEGRDRILPLAQSMPGARVVVVDYGSEAQARIAREFFGGHRVPTKDFRGGPYYSYFFALATARHDHVFHTDSDMFFGGTSTRWMAEAVAHMAANPEVLLAAPLPGPPRADGRLLTQSARAEPGSPATFIFPEMSTRLFLLSRARFCERLGALRARSPGWKNALIATLEGNPREDLPEHLFTDAMRAQRLIRREFLGGDGGRWSLHPPYRCADFYAKLPALVQQVESGHVPDAQRGCHDINGSLVDWSEGIAALKRNRWWRRLASRLG